MKSLRSALACGMLALSFSGAAHALVSSCTVSATGVAFGIYDPTVATATVSSGTVAVSCVVSGATGHNPITVALSAGNSGNFNSRTMLNGTDSLSYNLFLDAAYTQIWGDGTGVSLTDTVFVTPGKQSFNATVYGMMPALQTPGSGTFTDTITVSVSF
jgi:spore coat protein U-like protein